MYRDADPRDYGVLIFSLNEVREGLQKAGRCLAMWRERTARLCRTPTCQRTAQEHQVPDEFAKSVGRRSEDAVPNRFDHRDARVFQVFFWPPD